LFFDADAAPPPGFLTAGIPKGVTEGWRLRRKGPRARVECANARRLGRCEILEHVETQVDTGCAYLYTNDWGSGGNSQAAVNAMLVASRDIGLVFDCAYRTLLLLRELSRRRNRGLMPASARVGMSVCARDTAGVLIRTPAHVFARLPLLVLERCHLDRATNLRVSSPRVCRRATNSGVSNPRVCRRATNSGVSNPRVRGRATNLRASSPRVRRRATNLRVSSPRVRRRATNLRVSSSRVVSQPTLAAY